MMCRVHVVVLSTDPADGNPGHWRRAFEDAGATAEVLVGCPDVLPRADLVVAHVLIAGPVPTNDAWTAARRYESAGVRLLNSTDCLARCADKRATHRAWGRAGLAQPATWALEQLAPPARWPPTPVLVKPAFGESARGIALATSHAEARALAGTWGETAIVQEVVACRSVLRVHATATRVLGAFARPAAAIEGLPSGLSRSPAACGRWGPTRCARSAAACSAST